MENKIVIVEWTLDDIMGELKRISLVSEPAIEADFMMFGSRDMVFKALDEERRILTGPAMRPNLKIKRYDELGQLYYGTFSEEVVRQAAEMFFKKGSNTNKTNLEHEWEIEGVYVFESWIVENPENDKSKELGFSGVKKGDWFVSMKVDNDVVWNNYLKTGLIRGFSVEIRTEETEIDTIDLIKSVLDFKSIDDDLKWDMITSLVSDDFIDIEAKPYVDETGRIKKEPVMGLEEGVPHYTADGKLWTGPTHMDASGRLMTGATHTEESEYLYHEGELMEFSYDDYPEAASDNACKVLRWREEHGDEVKGMTRIGWVRANQLCNRKPISEETIARMSAFRRHKKNSEISDEYKGTPWKDAGYVAWLGWGGDAGVEWSARKLEQIRRD